jgi:membrane-associated phospholipid phosphatase
MPADRRAFFQKMLALAAFPSTGAAAIRKRVASELSTRQQQALDLREDAAIFQSQQPPAAHPTNGDETSLPAYIGNFTKGLPHTQLGEVEPGTYETLLYALSTGRQSDFEALDRGSGTKFVDPLAAFAFQMEGADSHCLGTPAPPAFASPDAAGEMVELYWQALARDVPFANYATSPITQAAIADLNNLSAFQGPTVNAKVTPATLFGGNVTGALTGPYISQFFWQPVPVNSTVVNQLYTAGAAGIDYLNSFDEWLVIQTGVPPFRAWTAAPQPKYIYNGRALAEWVHYDFLYQAYHNAALILLNQSPLTTLNVNPYLNPTNPYKTTKVETGFATFGAPHVCCLLGAACELALLAAWYQKWLLHRRTRPEEFGGRVHQTRTGAATYPIHTDLLNSAALKSAFAANGNYLLPQAYPEGAPLHPSYPSGHATVSGACSVILKAFFDETQILTNCVQASSDGTTLTPYLDAALTVGGEINKLAWNVAMGRDFAGIHYRSDAEAGIKLGESVAIAMLQDLVNTYAEDFTGFKFTRTDGTPVQIS